MLFTRLPVASPSASLSTVPYADIRRITPEFELDAFDHWLFDSGDSSALAGKVNGELLTTVGGASPVYGSNFLTINPATGKALQSAMIESRKQTICAVVRPNNAPSTLVIAGTRDGTNGSMLHFGSTLTNVVGTQHPTFTTTNPTTLAVDNWYFVALSETDAPGTMTAIVFASGDAVTNTGGSLKNLTGEGVALGNLAFTLATAATESFAEFILFDRALTAAELAAVYARSQQRMADRGITVA